MESQVYVRNHLQKCNDFVVEYWDREFEEYGHGEALHDFSDGHNDSN